MVITADEQLRGGKQLPLKAIVDEAIALGGCDTVKNVIVYRRTGGDHRLGPIARPLAARGDAGPGRDLRTRMGRRGAPAVPALHLAARPASPRACSIRTGGYLLHAALTTQWTFDLKPDDVFWCTADIGWVTGHTYIAYGPLALGATEVVFEGVPTYPDGGPLLEDDREAQGQRVLHRAHRHPLADQGGREPRRGAPDATTT